MTRHGSITTLNVSLDQLHSSGRCSPLPSHRRVRFTLPSGAVSRGTMSSDEYDDTVLQVRRPYGSPSTWSANTLTMLSVSYHRKRGYRLINSKASPGSPIVCDDMSTTYRNHI